jgi:phosphoglycerate kinase
LGDLWINDAFGTAHRAHASTTIIGRFFPGDKLFGLLMAREIEQLDKVLLHPERPFTAIMGGSKVSTKINIIMNLLDKVDNLILGGGMVYTFMKARGGEIGDSVREDDKLDLALKIIEAAREKGVNLVISRQTVAGDAFSNEANTRVVDPMQIPAGWSGMDIGPATREMFARVIEGSKTILWNGPVGVFEFPNFAAGTRAVADAIVKATGNGAFSLIGGGDSVAAITRFGLEEKVSYVSTGGGALLEYIEGIELPGIAAVRQ